MKVTDITLLLAVPAILLAAGCGGSEDGLARQTEQYQVIDEGAVSGITSTIHAPGDMAPVQAPTPDMTDTNLDTTTAFTILDPRVVTATSSTVDPLAIPSPPLPTADRRSDPAARQGATPGSTVLRSTPVPRPRETPDEPQPTPAMTPLPTPSSTALPRPVATPQPAPEPEEQDPPEEEEEQEEPEPTPPPAAETDTAPDSDTPATDISG